MMVYEDRTCDICGERKACILSELIDTRGEKHLGMVCPDCYETGD